MAAERDLGTFIERFETDNGRRRWICVIGVPLGAIAAAVGLWSIIAFTGTDAPSGATFCPALGTGAGLGAVFLGVYQGRLSFTRRDESFALHRGGLVYACAGRSWAIAWEEIAGVVDNGRDNPINRLTGTDISYYIRLAAPIDGRRSVSITAVTHGAEYLGETVRRAVQDRVRPDPSTG